MKEEDRLKLIEELKKQREDASKMEEFIPEESGKNTIALDCLLHSDYICSHDYGIKLGSECTCLDCGSDLSEEYYGVLYKANRGANIRKIRDKYIEILLYIDAETAITTLVDVYKLKMVKPKK